MSKKLFLLLLFVGCNLFLFNNYVYNNAAQAPAGYTNAPGDLGGCQTSGCHSGASLAIGSTLNDVDFKFYSGSPTAYVKGSSYNFLLSIAQGTYSNFGMQVTVLDASGNTIGTLSTINQPNTAISYQGGREYIGHSLNMSATSPYLFKWDAPANYLQGVATFYISAVAKRSSGERVFYKTFTFNPDSAIVVASLTADFSANELNPCIGESIDFSNLSTGNPTDYSWDFGTGASPATSTSPNPSVTYSTSGAKTVRLTVSKGATNDTETKTAYINVSAAPSANAGADQSICAGGQAQLQASGGVNYSWTPSAGLSNANIANPIASPSSTTLYIVKVTDANGCIDTDDVEVSISSAPVVNISDAAICPGESVVLDAGNPGFDYLWSTGSTNQTITVNQAGTYSVTVSSGSSCSASDAATITQLAGPLATAGMDEIICAGESVKLGYGAAPSTSYLWSPSTGLSDASASDPIASPSTTTEYILRTTDLNTNCMERDTVIVEVNPLPTVQLSGLAASYCISDNNAQALTLNPSGGILSGAGISGTSFTPANAGLGTHVIEYEYTEQVNQCTNTATVSVDVVPAPNASFSNLQSSYCAYDAAFTLAGTPSGGVFYIDAQSATSFSPANLGAGTYKVEYIVNVGTCADTARKLVDVIGNITPTISLASTIFCKGDNTAHALQAVPAGGNFSGFGVQASDFVASLAGVGTGTISYVFDTASCQFSANKSVTVYGVELGNDTTICEGDSILLNSNLSSNILWSTGANTPSIKVSPSVGTTEEYIVSGTDANACTTSDTIKVSAAVKPLISFNSIDSLYCTTDAPVSLSASPSGGVFSGPGVNSSSFDPQVAGAGGPYTLIYTYQSAGGCTVSDSLQVAVLQGFANPSFVGLDSIYCINNDAVALKASPLGGVFSGPGVVDSVFTPYFAGVGTHTLSYGLQSNNGCGSIKTVQVEVKALPQVQFTALPSSICANAGAYSLAGSPAGGVFSGAGVVDSLFHPEKVVVGNSNVLSYTFTDTYGCSKKVDQFVNVLKKPNATILSHPLSLCEGDAPLVLKGQPANGQFYINGVSGNTLVPDSSALGNNEIAFVVVNNNTCADTSYSSITVNARPSIAFDISTKEFCAYPIDMRLSAEPAGGIFSGAAVVHPNIFSPSNAPLGLNIISYTYTDSNSCYRTVSDSVEILALPEIELSGLDASYCNSEDTVALTVSPVGGDLSGSGLSGFNFIPSAAGEGEIIIRYTVTNTADCANVYYQEVRVDDCTGIEEAKENIEWNVYPNPTNGVLMVDISSLGEAPIQINLLDMQGRLIALSNVVKNKNLGRFEIDLSDLNSGIYLLQVKGTSYVDVKRVVRL